jgi:hypothetical protein
MRVIQNQKVSLVLFGITHNGCIKRVYDHMPMCDVLFSDGLEYFGMSLDGFDNGKWKVFNDQVSERDIENWLKNKDGILTVWSVDVTFDQTIHVIPLGFTDYVPCKFVMARNADEANEKVKNHYNNYFKEKGESVQVENTLASLAKNPFTKTYTFPEKII